MVESEIIRMCHLNNYYSIRQQGIETVNTGKPQPSPGQMMMSSHVKCNLDLEPPTQEEQIHSI